jgi:hypothetical protein
MPLLILVILGAVGIWLITSIFFEQIGAAFIKIVKKFKNK